MEWENELGVTWQGASKWSYTMVFDPSLLFIVVRARLVYQLARIACKPTRV